MLPRRAAVPLEELSVAPQEGCPRPVLTRSASPTSGPEGDVVPRTQGSTPGRDHRDLDRREVVAGDQHPRPAEPDGHAVGGVTVGRVQLELDCADVAAPGTGSACTEPSASGRGALDVAALRRRRAARAAPRPGSARSRGGGGLARSRARPRRRPARRAGGPSRRALPAAPRRRSRPARRARAAARALRGAPASRSRRLLRRSQRRATQDRAVAWKIRLVTTMTS